MNVTDTRNFKPAAPYSHLTNTDVFSNQVGNESTENLRGTRE